MVKLEVVALVQQASVTLHKVHTLRQTSRLSVRSRTLHRCTAAVKAVALHVGEDLHGLQDDSAASRERVKDGVTILHARKLKHRKGDVGLQRNRPHESKLVALGVGRTIGCGVDEGTDHHGVDVDVNTDANIVLFHLRRKPVALVERTTRFHLHVARLEFVLPCALTRHAEVRGCAQRVHVDRAVLLPQDVVQLQRLVSELFLARQLQVTVVQKNVMYRPQSCKPLEGLRRELATCGCFSQNCVDKSKRGHGQRHVRQVCNTSLAERLQVRGVRWLPTQLADDTVRHTKRRGQEVGGACPATCDAPGRHLSNPLFILTMKYRYCSF
eukprot:Rhum_TRINITY_DN2693_c0_g1::Rhum_TRINITY_DN2693_c0_g1_i1::g.7721::m.7721